MDFDAGFGANFNGQGNLTMTDVVIDQCSTTNGDGGGLSLFDGGTVTLTNCQFTNNRAVSNGGNSAGGGGVYVGITNGHATNYTFTNCTFTGNATAGVTPAGGGGFYSFAGNMTFRGCTFSNNSTGGASSDGGGINSVGPVTIDQGSVFTGNTATRWGGGIYVTGTGNVITNTTITGNNGNGGGTTGGFGAGGIFLFGTSARVTVTNCRIAGNVSPVGGSQLGCQTDSGAAMNAINNWFGTNAPPASFFGAGVTANPYLVLAVSASPTAINTGQTSTVTAAITRNSNAQTGFTVPNATPVTFAATLGTMNPTSSTLTSGSRTSTFTAGGTGGNGSASATVDSQTLSASITVTQPPAITSGNSATFVVGSAGNFTVSASGSPAPTLSVSGTLPAGVTFTPGTGALAGTPAAGTGGTYGLTFTATNSAGSASQNFTLTVNQAPAITSANATTFTVGSPGTFTVTTTGVPAVTVSQAGTLPNGVTFDSATKRLSGTPAAGTGGSYSITFTGSNGVGSNAMQNFTLTVNQAPAITSGNTATFIVGRPNSFTVVSTGSPTPTVGQTGALPPGVTFTANANGTGTLSGNPAAGSNPSYPLTFTATNGVNPAASQPFTLVINRPPVAGNDTLGTEQDKPVSASVAKLLLNDSDPDGDPLAITAVASPSSQSGAVVLSAPGNNGTITYTPAAGFKGTDLFTYTLSDGRGGTATGMVTVTVRDRNAPSSQRGLHHADPAEHGAHQVRRHSGRQLPGAKHDRSQPGLHEPARRPEDGRCPGPL